MFLGMFTSSDLAKLTARHDSVDHGTHMIPAFLELRFNVIEQRFIGELYGSPKRKP
jgi:hypothetical protein